MKQINLTSNFNGIFNREEGTTFGYVAPSFHFEKIQKDDIFEIYFKNILFGTAKIIDVVQYEPKTFSNTASLIIYGYPLKSFLTAMQKMYVNFDFEKTSLIMIVFVWQEKIFKGLKKTHTFFKNS